MCEVRTCFGSYGDVLDDGLDVGSAPTSAPTSAYTLLRSLTAMHVDSPCLPPIRSTKRRSAESAPMLHALHMVPSNKLCLKWTFCVDTAP